MKTNIKMKVTPEQSRKVQEICFKNNITWNGLKAFDHIKEPFIYIYDSRLSYDCGKDNRFFNNHSNEEIDADLFIRTNGTCEEISDEGLSKIKAAFQGKPIEYLQEKVINLHKQINKDRNVINNQKKELHKLNLKLQKSISLEEHHLKMKTVLNEKHKLEVENKELGRLVNLNASALVLVGQRKDLAMQKIEEQSKEIENLKAVIEYLESKLK